MEKTIRVAAGAGATPAIQNKRRYEPPLLMTYGSVKTLTAAGSGVESEQAGASPNCDSSPDHQRACL